MVLVVCDGFSKDKGNGMSFRLQIIICGAVLIIFALLVRMIWKKKIDLRYALPWLCLCVGMLVLDFFPGITSRLAELMGISLPINMMFFLGFCFCLLIIFTITMSLSRMARKQKQLAQELALLRREMEEMKEKSTEERICDKKEGIGNK